jgi:hypothetical protein
MDCQVLGRAEKERGMGIILSDYLTNSQLRSKLMGSQTRVLLDWKVPKE